jgi:hypothetical protein
MSEPWDHDICMEMLLPFVLTLSKLIIGKASCFETLSAQAHSSLVSYKFVANLVTQESKEQTNPKSR